MTTSAPSGPPRLRGAVVLGGTVAAVGVPVVLLLLAGGVAAAQAGRITLVVVLQWATGALLWRLARGPVPASVTEVVGMGLALGTLGSLLGTQVLLPLGLGGLGWLAPPALVLGCLALPAVRSRLRSGGIVPPTVDEVGAVVAGLAIGLLVVRAFWQAHPLEWTGWWRYYLDIPHHEALATSLTTWGPGDDILLAGQPIRYHWFSHAWSGALTDAASADSFVAVTRALPVVALLGTVCLVVAWARLLSPRRTAPLLAVLVTGLAAGVGAERGLLFVEMAAVSPSLGLGALWFLGAALLLPEHLHRRVSGGLPLLALLTVGCMGGKTSYAAVLGGGAGLVAFASLWEPRLRARAWQAFGVVVLALAGAFAALILGSTGNLRLEAGASAATLGILPDGTPLGLLVGTVGVGLVLAAAWAGLAALLSDRRTALRPELWFAGGAAGAGLVLMAVLGHPGSSQLYFPVSAGPVVGVVSAWGLAEGLARMSRGWIVAAVLVGGAAAALGLAGVPGLPRWSAPYAVWLLPLALAAVGLARSTRAGGRVRAPSVLAVGLVSAALVTGLATVVGTVRAGPPAPAVVNAPGAWTQEHETALRWLRENADRDDVVATNRQCVAPRPAARPCEEHRWFLTAALGQRRMYVEGADYAAGLPLPAWVQDRVDRSRRFADAPAGTDARTLWDAGVRWVVVDLASTRTRAWAPYAEEAFATGATVVLRLARP